MKFFIDDCAPLYLIDLYKTNQLKPYYKYRYQMGFLWFGCLFGKNPYNKD